MTTGFMKIVSLLCTKSPIRTLISRLLKDLKTTLGDKKKIASLLNITVS